MIYKGEVKKHLTIFLYLKRREKNVFSFNYYKRWLVRFSYGIRK